MKRVGGSTEIEKDTSEEGGGRGGDNLSVHANAGLLP